MPGLGLLLLRLLVGLLCVAHGLPKLLPVWGGSPAVAAAAFESAGLVPGYPIVVATGIVESLGGLLLMAGAYTPWIALLLAAARGATGGALYAALAGGTDRLLSPAVQLDAMVIGAVLCLLLAGPGALSVDARRRGAAESDAMGRARLRARST